MRQFLFPLLSGVFFSMLSNFPAGAQSAAGPGERRPREELSVSGLDLSLNRVTAVHAAFPELTGRGLTVSVKETLFDTTDIDFRGRVLPSPVSGRAANTHPTIMATIIAGGGNSFKDGLGVAWEAALTSSDFTGLLPEDDAVYEQLSVSVQNHSYGVGIENFYGADAAAYDASVTRRPGLVHVFSAGNSGTETSEAGPYASIAGYANLTGSFKMGKNVLLAGAVDSEGRIEERSSRGPAYDGRIKPDLVAYGQDGSSGAAAIVSGIALLLQQAWRDRRGDLPPAALVRAVLLNSARDTGAPGPDFAAGYGLADAYGALETILDEHTETGRLEQGKEEFFSIVIPPGASNLKITLAWTDPPAAPDAPRALVNDLDLELYHPATGRRWRPWTLSVFPHPDSLATPARPGRDSLNNAEQITVGDPPPGEYRIVVAGRSVPTGPQPFALAYGWETPGAFRWDFPAAIDHLTAGTPAYLRWTSTLPAEQGMLEIAFDDSDNWETVAAEVPLGSGFFRWDIPDTTATVRLRLRAGDRLFHTDAFTITRPPTLRVGFDCADSVLLFWEREPRAAAYQLFALTGRYLEPVATVADTFFILDKNTSSSLFYSVAPLLRPGRPGLRSPTVNYTRQGVGCYIRTLVADYREGNRAHLRLLLGSDYRLSSVTFEKRREGVFLPIRSITPAAGLEYEYTDPDLHAGINYYRARLELAGGETIVSDPVQVYSSGPAAHLVFPNPVPAGEPLRLVSGDLPGEVLFQLFDGLGRVVRQQTLIALVEEVETEGLTAGVYFYLFSSGGEKREAGKVVVRP